MVDPEWIEHRRGRDGELLGWMAPQGDGFVVIDLLGHPRSDLVDWLEAEETLDALGIGYLAESYELLLDDGQWLRVRITEVSVDEVRLKKEDWGAMDAPQVYYSTPFPVGQDLRLARGNAASPW